MPPFFSARTVSAKPCLRSEISVGTSGTGDDVEIASMISKVHYERVLAALDGLGYSIEPTVVTDARWCGDHEHGDLRPGGVRGGLQHRRGGHHPAKETVYGLAAVYALEDFSRTKHVMYNHG